jgi:ribosomal protein L37AE/L43A
MKKRYYRQIDKRTFAPEICPRCHKSPIRYKEGTRKCMTCGEILR